MPTAAEPQAHPVPELLQGLRCIYDAAAQGVCVVLGEELRIAYVNPTGLRLIDLPEGSSIVGLPIDEATPKAERGRLLRVLRTGRPLIRTGNPYRAADGVVRYWDFTVHPLTCGAGPTGLVITATDVTARERDARAVLAELPAILEGMADAVVVMRSGRCARVNPAAVRLCGESGPDELLGLSARELRRRYQFQLLHGHARLSPGTESLAEGRSARMVRRDGSAAVVSLSVSPLPGRENEHSLVCVLRDVTAEHQTQRALDEALADSRRQAERLAAIIESIPVAVRIWDREGHLRQQNRQAVEIVGEQVRSLGEDAGAGPSVAATGTSAHDAAAARALRGERVDRCEATIIDINGAQRHLLVSAAALYGPDGKVAEAVSVMVDETEKRRLERLKDEFLAILAHELRNPLAAAQASLQAAVRGLGAGDGCAPSVSPRLTRHLHRGLEQVTRVGGILANLLEVGRVGTVRSHMGLQDVDLVKLCRRSVQEASAADALHTYAFQTGVPHLPARVDPYAVAEAVGCLLSNARKYSGPGLPIRVELGRSGDSASVRVRDHGVGVPRGEEERIFEGFYRGENVRGPGGPSGLGIGLFVARTLVVNHGGTIGVEGCPGGGSVFAFKLPLGL